MEVEGVSIKINFNEENYMKMLTKVHMGEQKHFVSEFAAAKWIEDTIVGPVTKEILE